MSDFWFKLGQDSIVLRCILRDSSTGQGKTGLTSASSGLIIGTIADNEAATTVYTSVGATIETITTLGTYAAPTATKCRFKEVDGTNHKGLYEIQIANARFSVVSSKGITISLQCTGVFDKEMHIPLQVFDVFSNTLDMRTVDTLNIVIYALSVLCGETTVTDNGDGTTTIVFGDPTGGVGTVSVTVSNTVAGQRLVSILA